MRRAILLGHLNPALTRPLGHHNPALLEEGFSPGQHRLTEVAKGLQEAGADWEVHTVPFGPGELFVQQYPGSCSLDTAGRDAPDLPAHGSLVIEMGHDQGHDWGRRLWDRHPGAELRSREIVVAYSTPRPLYGAGGTASTSPDLDLRTQTDEPDGWRRHLDELYEETQSSRMALPSPTGEIPVSRLPGSGAGGGAAAWLAALGARLHPAEEVLADHLQLRERIAQADLLIVASPFWNSPDLAEALPLYGAQLAKQVGIPVVGIGLEATLSAHEQAQWGIHGLHTAQVEAKFARLGRRVGQTWMRGAC